MMLPEPACCYSSAYDQLRKMIIHQTFQPGQKLKISEIADQLKMSPTPVREALSRLAQEQFIETRQQRGFFIKWPEINEMKELYSLIHLNADFMLRHVYERGRLPRLAVPLSQIFCRPCPIAARHGMWDLAQRLEDLSEMANAGRALMNMFLRTHHFRLCEFSNPERFAILRSFTAEMSVAARDNRITDCLERNEACHRQRLGWIAKLDCVPRPKPAPRHHKGDEFHPSR
jgi:DNA-binding transcriptional MocR family regulator